MRKWLPAVPILIGLGISAGAYSRLPANVTPDWGRVFPFGAGTETMPRMPFLLLLPVVAIAVWAGLAAGARVAGRRGGAFLNDETGAKAIERFEPTFAIVVTGVVGLVVLLHADLVASVADWPDWTMKAVGVVLGAGTAAIGNLMPRVKPNWIVGIRTRATLRDPALWMRTHRYFGGLLMLVGIGVAILSLFASHYAFAATAIGLLIAAVVAHWFARTRTATPQAVVLVSFLLCAHGSLGAQATDAQFAERTFEIPTRDIVLPGTLTLPLTSGPFPVVVLVAGSGPTDRDGNGLQVALTT